MISCHDDARAPRSHAAAASGAPHGRQVRQEGGRGDHQAPGTPAQRRHDRASPSLFPSRPAPCLCPGPFLAICAHQTAQAAGPVCQSPTRCSPRLCALTFVCVPTFSSLQSWGAALVARESSKLLAPHSLQVLPVSRYSLRRLACLIHHIHACAVHLAHAHTHNRAPALTAPPPPNNGHVL